jgi:hypothetical protein
MARSPAHWLLFPVLLTAWGCGAGWHRLADLSPRPLPARTQVQIWEGEQVRILHGVTLGRDSIAGVPFTLPPGCDSCRVSLALSGVDSLRVGNKERGFVRTVQWVLVVGSVWAFIFRGVGGD